jgi:hypothetical protein
LYGKSWINYTGAYENDLSAFSYRPCLFCMENHGWNTQWHEEEMISLPAAGRTVPSGSRSACAAASDPCGGRALSTTRSAHWPAWPQLSPRLPSPMRGRYSHHHTTLYILYRDSLMKYTGRCENGFNVLGSARPRSAGRSGPPPLAPPPPRPPLPPLLRRAACPARRRWSKKSVSLAQKMHVGPCIPVG